LDNGLDHRVARRQRGSDAVTAVSHDICIAVADETHRRRLAAVLEPQSVLVDRSPVDAAATTRADSDLVEPNPDHRVSAAVGPARADVAMGPIRHDVPPLLDE
jgi:hypothetical protein